MSSIPLVPALLAAASTATPRPSASPLLPPGGRGSFLQRPRWPPRRCRPGASRCEQLQAPLPLLRGPRDRERLSASTSSSVKRDQTTRLAIQWNHMSTRDGSANSKNQLNSNLQGPWHQFLLSYSWSSSNRWKNLSPLPHLGLPGLKGSASLVSVLGGGIWRLAWRTWQSKVGGDTWPGASSFACYSPPLPLAPQNLVGKG